MVPSSSVPHVVNNGFLLLFFAWDSLFFAYGEVRMNREAA
jgi:hypothetical protein